MTMWRCSGVAALLLVGCAARPLPPSPFEHDLGPPAHEVRLRYELRWRGAVVGDVALTIARRGDAVTVDRRETLRLRRGDARVVQRAEVHVEATSALVPRRLCWTIDDAARRCAAVQGDAWQEGTQRVADAAAVPSELVPLLAQRDGGFAGPVLLPGPTLLVGDGAVTSLADGQHLTQVELGGARRQSVVTLGPDGLPDQIVDDTGVSAHRVATVARADDDVDVLALGALAIAGPADPATGLELTLGPGAPAAWPALPGQDVVARDAGRVALTLAAPPTATRDAAIAAITAEVAAAIAPSLAPTTDAAGDCTTYALALHAALRRAGFAAQLVTGFVIVDGALRRHRWVAAWSADRWWPVDAAFGEAPAGPTHVALRLHDASAAALWAADAAFTAIVGARYLPALRPDHAS